MGQAAVQSALRGAHGGDGLAHLELQCGSGLHTGLVAQLPGMLGPVGAIRETGTANAADEG